QTPEYGGGEQLARGHTASIQPDQPATAHARATKPLSQSASTGLSAHTVPPWTVALVPSHLGKERACLLGLGLTLYDRPAMAHSRAFLSHLRAWWVAQDMTAPPTDHSAPWPQHQASVAIGRESPEEAKRAPGLDQATPSAAQSSSTASDALPHSAAPR